MPTYAVGQRVLVTYPYGTPRLAVVSGWHVDHWTKRIVYEIDVGGLGTVRVSDDVLSPVAGDDCDVPVIVED